ncbi:hypothetical protein C7446_2330 [Kushneria sinocarnis]|uniref:Uncharacterized protein n=1 Tax=Kushneria sinocarnis TaxID=595502 RepID=A0A420WVQ5_9GAMM|nr:hypothetical protein [Kushneria sinocarnis]RKR02612.1 hypothetical protein C7446_2330 [Kushneria sinocarnis]
MRVTSMVREGRTYFYANGGRIFASQIAAEYGVGEQRARDLLHAMDGQGEIRSPMRWYRENVMQAQMRRAGV